MSSNDNKPKPPPPPPPPPSTILHVIREDYRPYSTRVERDVSEKPSATPPTKKKG